MEKTVLIKKGEAFDNAVNKYKEYRKTFPKHGNNKLDFESFTDAESSVYDELINYIWNTKAEYIYELNVQKFTTNNSKDNKQHSILNFENRDLYILYNKIDDNYYNNNIRFTLVGVKEDNHIRLGLSICSEKDNFSRKIGRELAYKRALNGNWLVPLKIVSPVEIRNYLQSIVNDIDENMDWYKTNFI